MSLKRAAVLALSAITALAFALPATAKGVLEATITGPGIEEPIVLDGRQAASLQDGRLEALINGIAFWEVAYIEADSPHRLKIITAEAPTSELGPEYVVTIGHGGPAGLAHVDVLVYPAADGGALAYVEPGVEIEEARTVTSGGWYRSSADLAGMFEEYGAVMPGAALVWLPYASVSAMSFLLVRSIRKRKRDGLV